MDDSEHEMEYFGVALPFELYQSLHGFRVENFKLLC